MSGLSSVSDHAPRKWLRAGVAAIALGAATVGMVQPAAAFGHGGFHGGGVRFFPHGGFRGGYGGGFRGGYGYRGWHRGYGYGLGGLGVGLALGSAYGYGNPYGYYGAGYGGYYGGYGGYNNCLRRVWGAYGPHWVNVCY